MALWTPAELTTALWLDAADGDTLTIVNSVVSQWDDKSGNDRHLSQSTANQRPAVQSGELDSKDVIRFDGSNDYLVRNGFFTLGSVGCVAVIKYRSLGSTSALALSARWDGGAGKRFYLWADNSNFTFAVGGNPATTTITTTSNTGWNLFSQFAVGGTHYAGLNGADVGSEANTDTSSPEWFSLGALVAETGSSATNFATCDIAELVFVTSTADRQKLEGYLAHKWGLEGSLDSDHPYKSNPPYENESSVLAVGPLASATLLGGVPADSRVLAQGPLADCSAVSVASLGAFASAPGPLAEASVLTLLNLDAEAIILTTGPLASAEITAYTLTPMGVIGAIGPLASAAVLVQPFPQAGVWSAIGPLASGLILTRWQPPDAAAIPSGITHYHCLLTGAPDGLPDTVLPIKSFSVRHRESTASYYQIVIPSLGYVDALTARPNGEIVIWSDTDGATEELMRGSLGDVRSDRGPNSQSITISGNASRAATPLATYTVTDVLYQYSTFDGEHRLRIRPRAGIRPGDTIRYGGTFFTVGLVSWSVSVSDTGLSAQMEVAALAESV